MAIAVTCDISDGNVGRVSIESDTASSSAPLDDVEGFRSTGYLVPDLRIDETEPLPQRLSFHFRIYQKSGARKSQRKLRTNHRIRIAYRCLAAK